MNAKELEMRLQQVESEILQRESEVEKWESDVRGFKANYAEKDAREQAKVDQIIRGNIHSMTPGGLRDKILQREKAHPELKQLQSNIKDGEAAIASLKKIVRELRQEQKVLEMQLAIERMEKAQAGAKKEFDLVIRFIMEGNLPYQTFLDHLDVIKEEGRKLNPKKTVAQWLFEAGFSHWAVTWVDSYRPTCITDHWVEGALKMVLYRDIRGENPIYSPEMQRTVKDSPQMNRRHDRLGPQHDQGDQVADALARVMAEM